MIARGRSGAPIELRLMHIEELVNPSYTVDNRWKQQALLILVTSLNSQRIENC
jgi:hypothetical protein